MTYNFPTNDNSAATATMGASSGLGTAPSGSSLADFYVGPGGQQQGGFKFGSSIYDQYMQQAMQKLMEEEQSGRGDLQKYYEQGLGFGAPYRAAGASGLEAYLGTLGLGGPGAQKKAIDSFKTSPGYQFALQQGLQGVQRGEAAKGLGGSGAEMRALQQTGQGLANQQYGQYQQRLASLAGMGQSEADRAAQMATGMGGSLAQLGEFYGGSQAQLMSTLAQMQLEKEEAAKQRKSSLWGGLGSLFGDALSFL